VVFDLHTDMKVSKREEMRVGEMIAFQAEK
jgi:hypothetical protein